MSAMAGAGNGGRIIRYLKCTIALTCSMLAMVVYFVSQSLHGHHMLVSLTNVTISHHSRDIKFSVSNASEPYPSQAQLLEDRTRSYDNVLHYRFNNTVSPVNITPKSTVISVENRLQLLTVPQRRSEVTDKHQSSEARISHQSQPVLSAYRNQSQAMLSAYRSQLSRRQALLRKTSHHHDQYSRLSLPRTISKFRHFNLQPNDSLVHFPYMYRQHIIDNRTVCTKREFSSVPLPVTVLASFPGSGNTWTRHLIELATGKLTGAVFDDRHLRMAFPAEGIMNDRVVVVKTHCPWYGSCVMNKQRAIVVVRHPQEAIKSAKTYLSTHNHRAVLRHIDPEEWKAFYTKELGRWNEFHQFWLGKAFAGHLDLFILFYEDMKENLARAVVNMAYFLGIDHLSDSMLECTMSRQEGYYHRAQSSAFDNLEFFVERTNNVVKFINQLIGECVQNRQCTTSGGLSLHP